MFCSRLGKELKFLRSRQLHSTLVKYEEKAVPDNANKPSGQPRIRENMLGSPVHFCSNLDKRILVWVKRYPSLDQVPNEVTVECIQKAHSTARVRVSFIMMGIAIVGFIISAIMGKKDVASGKTILSERLKYYEKIKEQKQSEENTAKQ